MNRPIKPKERETIIQSLRSGVVPRLGLHHIQVGRSEELKSFVKDVDTIADGGTSFRFVIGEYGSGKTFFLSMVRSIALEKGLVTIHADLSPSKRLYGAGGKARLLISELISNMSTRSKQDGNALPNILEKFIMTVQGNGETQNVGSIITTELQEINNYTCGYSFSTVIRRYWDGFNNGDDLLKTNALRWLRAEYNSKSDAYRDLGVRDIISDASFYDTLKLFSVLVRKAGYKGLLVCLDELVNLYKITSAVARRANYEEILYMLNNTLQGTFPGIGFILCGTPEFIYDERRGLYSYDALKSRLAHNSFADRLGLTDYSATVLTLSSLSREELFILLKNLRHVYATGDESKYTVPDEALIAFMKHCEDKIGESYFRTPRTTIKSFLDLLSMLEQYPSLTWENLIDSVDIVEDVEDSGITSELSKLSDADSGNDEAFASFKL